MTTRSDKSAQLRVDQSVIWMWETYIAERLNGGAGHCRQCAKQTALCVPYANCKDPNCDYCESCTARHCERCHYNQHMARVIRARDSYQQALRDYWEGTNWNPLPWTEEFYATYDFSLYYLGKAA